MGRILIMYDGETLQATKRHRNKKDKRRHNVVGDRAAKAGTPGAALKSLERKNKLKGMCIYICVCEWHGIYFFPSSPKK